MDIGAAHPGRLPGGRDRGRVHDLPLRRGGHHQRPALLRRLRALPQVSVHALPTLANRFPRSRHSHRGHTPLAPPKNTPRASWSMSRYQVCWHRVVSILCDRKPRRARLRRCVHEPRLCAFRPLLASRVPRRARFRDPDRLGRRRNDCWRDKFFPRRISERLARATHGPQKGRRPGPEPAA